MIDYQKCFIENVKFYRKQKRFSQADLAEACDVSNGTIGNIQCGLTKPSFDLLIKIADSLDIQPQMLFYDKKTPESPQFILKTFTENQLFRIKKAFSSAMKNALNKLKDMELN